MLPRTSELFIEVWDVKADSEFGRTTPVDLVVAPFPNVLPSLVVFGEYPLKPILHPKYLSLSKTGLALLVRCPSNFWEVLEFQADLLLGRLG